MINNNIEKAINMAKELNNQSIFIPLIDGFTIKLKSENGFLAANNQNFTERFATSDAYDDFNNLRQIYKYDEPIPLKCINQIDYLNKRIYKLIVGVIYVALAGYISQNIMKANIAYEYGIKILENELLTILKI